MRTIRSYQYLPRLFVLSLFVSLAMAGAPAASGGAVGAQTPVQDPAAAGAQSAPAEASEPSAALSAAAAQLLHLLDQQVNDGAVELGAQLIREHSDDAALHALYALSLAGIGLWKEALAVDKQHLVRWPSDAWAQVVRAYLMRDPARTDDAVAAATRAMRLAPEDADIARVVMRIYAAHLQYDQAIALADSFITSGRGTDLIHLEKYKVFEAITFLPGRRDTVAEQRADAALALALAKDSHSAATYQTAGARHLWDRRPADALPLLERAVSLSPLSSPIRRAYWRGISAQADIPAEQRRALIHADMDAFLEAWEHRVEARFTVATHLYILRDTVRLIPMWDLIRSEHAGTWQAAMVAFDRAWLAARSGWEQATTNADSMRVTRVLRDELWPITTMPGANSIALGRAYSQLFRIFEQDSTSSADDLFSVFERYEQQYPWPPPSRRHSILPVALAERGSRLDLAEELARAGLEPREDFLAWQQGYYTVAEYAEQMDWVKADYHATIGWVLFHKGDIAEAKRELEQAHEILNTAPAPPYRLGRIAEAEGDIEEAERWYATGRGRENWDRRSSEALERIYLARHASLDGFDEYLGAIDERDLERRLAKVESERIADPEPLPNFEHDWMNGGRFSSDSLKGKVAVINFWGVWCGPCVREAPDIQKFAEKFRNHPDVVFITVANDVDLDVTRDFMKEKGYDFPVIFDEGLVGLANIYAFPTTLFVDRDGRIVFSLIGAELHLVDEYTWRAEALLGRPVAAAVSAQSAPAEASKPDATLSDAATQLLHLLDHRVNDDAVELGARLIREHPEDAPLHALYVISLSDYRGLKQAMRLSEEYALRWPNDAWVEVARGYVIRDRTRTDEALAAAARARQLAPANVDIARHVMSIHAAHLLHGQAVALADSFITSGRASPQLRAATASILTDMASFPGIRDTAAAPLAKRELEIALAETSPSVTAYLVAAGTARRERRADDALPLLERAVALSPRSNAVRLAYWRGLAARRDVPADEKQAAIRASIDSFLEARQHAVGARLAVAEYFQSLRDTAQYSRMADLIQREHAGTWHAAQIAGVRARNEANAAYAAANSKADSAAVTRQLREALWAITSMPGASSGVLAGTYSQLFAILTQDSTTAADELLSVVERIEEHSSSRSATPRYSALPEALAERGSRLDYAEQLARAAREHREDNLEGAREYFTVALYADILDWEKSGYHATLGWVLFHKGEIAEAKRELEEAHQAMNIAPTPPYRLGRIAEAEGDIEAAERWYATGRGRENWDRRSSEALERLYLASNESLDGFDAHLLAIDERDRERRLAKILSDRIAEPEPLPEFEHDWMNGGRFSSELLQGKVAVINFWGVWCAPCVREAPDVQEFAEKFRDHPDVVVITVSSDNDPDVTRDFMVEKGYDFPVVLDGGLARMLNIFAWPTTLFVDRDGRIVFSALGASLRLVEEYTWRVEALLGGPVADAGEAEPVNLESAITQVRSLYFGRDFHHAAAVGDAALEHWPESSELVAWTVAALSRTRPTPAAQAIYSSASADAALERAEALAKARPDDVWGAIAFAHALTYHTDRRGEALTASLRPLELAPTLPEAVWLRGLVLDEHRRYEEVISLIEEKWPIVDRQWAELLTVQGNAHLAWRSVKGPELRARGLDILAQARELDSENVNAHYLAGDALLWDRRVDEAANLVARAAALSPGASDIASLHWRLIKASPSLDSAHKQALIRASANELVAQRGQYPSILRRIARDLGWMGLPAEAAALQDRVLAEFANTEEAEWVLSDQWEELSRRSYFGQVEDTLAHRAELSTMLWSFIERSHHYQPALLGNAYRTLFINEERDATVSSDTLLFLARGAVEHGRGWPIHSSVATGLAERGAHLTVAREIARDGIDAVEEFVARRIDFYPTPGIAADVLNRALTSVYNAISYVELKAGDLVAAREATNQALALKSESSEVQLQAGAVAEAEGDWESAEFHYASGERLERLSPGDKPNRQALERMYTARHGSMEGYEVFVAGIEERHRARRRQQVADSRIAEPEVLPAIDLEWLTGGRIGANELEDRIVVINFWGVWCSPCVAEAPQIQQLHEKYRDDPGVVFLTVDVYDDPDDVRTWMAENKYDFPVLLDDHFAASAGVRSYPTTWFVDRNGRIVFSYSGETAEVFEEFVWRIEMLQAEAAVTAEGGGVSDSSRNEGRTP